MITYLLIGLLVIVISYKSCCKPKDFPPGPAAIPLFGSLLFIPMMGGVLSMAAEWFIKRYGKMVGVYLGNYPAVVLYDLEDVKLLFSDDKVSGRPDSFVYRYRMLGDKLGLLFNEGEDWKIQRRFVLKTLKDFGFGKKGLENVIIEEADKMGDLFRAKSGEPFLVQNLFNVAILNVLWTIVANHRYDLTDPSAQTLVKLIADSIKVEGLRFLFAIPVSRFFAPEWTGWNKQKQVVGETQALIRNIIEEHKQSYDENNMRDFIDVYLREMNSGAAGGFSDEQLVVNAMDLFSAGSETTSTTLAWAIAFSIIHPEVQEKVQAEIDDELGDRAPTLEDIDRLVYTQATIMEIQRLGSIAPQAVPHKSLQSVKINGYTIPKGTFVFSMLYHIMRDPDIWQEPERFNPERFLTSTGKLIKHQHFVPFGVGKRLCLGESLAKSELFIIYTRLLQQFTFEKCEGLDQPSSKPVPGFIMAPKPFYARAVPRN